MRLKKAADEIFPLQNDRRYRIVSRVAKNGACEVFIDGKLVATATIGSAKPLSLEIPDKTTFPGASGWGELLFKGEDLPMDWQGGWAGVIVGPHDGGTHACYNLDYTKGISELPAAE